MKKLLLPLLFLSTFAQAQWYFVSDFTLCLSQAPNSVLDSTIVMGNSTQALIQSNSYTYDWKERLLTKKFRDVTNTQTELSSFNYDANDSVVRKTVMSGQSAPTLTMLTVNTRNASKQLEYDTVSYASSSQYTLNNASIYSYDANGYLAEREMSSFNGSWTLFNRRQFVNTNTGKPLSILFQGWINNTWANSSLTTYTYNSNNNPSSQVLQFWNNNAAAFLNQSRSHWDYTGTHIDTFTTFSWVNTWRKNTRYTYSASGSIDSVTIDSWNGTQLEGYRRYVRTWTQGQLASVVEKAFNNGWKNSRRYDYLYDANGNHTVTNLSVYNSPADPWVLLIVTKHYYRASTVGIQELTLNDTKTYPVPSAGMLYFDSALPVKSGTIYSASGSEVIRFEGNSVDLSSSVPGVYYVRLILEDGNFRMVKAIRE